MQVREEEEEEALEYIRRNRRQGDVQIEAEELKMLGNRFSRIGKEKSQSGQAYQEMTKSVIVSGALGGRLQLVAPHARRSRHGGCRTRACPVCSLDN